MPVKILLADKSITIQKVVEMLFSGKEYEVVCVSDGDTALGEASRIVPDVVLADVDLPRIDGYRFAGRLKEVPALAQVPVILMLSRDDVYDAGKGKHAGIVDNIAKPFESQDLIGKVKKALSGAPASAPATPVQKAAPAAPPPPQKAVAASPPSMTKKPQAVPSDIFDIIQEAPAQPAAPVAPIAPAPPKAEKIEDETFDVEPEFEVEPEAEPEQPASHRPPQAVPSAAQSMEAEAAEWARLAAEPDDEVKPVSVPQSAVESPDSFDTDTLFGRAPSPAASRDLPKARPAEIPSFEFGVPISMEEEKALPVGQKAMEEMREGLGLAGDSDDAATRHPDIVSFESLDMASRASHEDYAYTPPVAKAPPAPATQPAAARAPEQPAKMPSGAQGVSDDMLKGVAREVIEKAAREILERVAWEVIPDLAERLIREEIERLKAEK